MVYSDVVKNGLILPRKEKYTKSDYKKLVKTGYLAKEARFICICSAIYHNSIYSNFFDSLKLRVECKII